MSEHKERVWCTDFYVFVAWKNAEGAQSKPSAPLRIRLKDGFYQK